MDKAIQYMADIKGRGHLKQFRDQAMGIRLQLERISDPMKPFEEIICFAKVFKDNRPWFTVDSP
jgi:hypothetical protein